MLVANIITMLGSKNTWNSGKCSLPLPPQYSNFQFFDSSEIEDTERVVKERGLQACDTLRILVEGLALWFPAVYRRQRPKFLNVKMSF